MTHKNRKPNIGYRMYKESKNLNTTTDAYVAIPTLN